ncbi:hypothetical protein D3C77_578270 [compost metagenome]
MAVTTWVDTNCSSSWSFSVYGTPLLFSSSTPITPSLELSGTPSQQAASALFNGSTSIGTDCALKRSGWPPCSTEKHREAAGSDGVASESGASA